MPSRTVILFDIPREEYGLFYHYLPRDPRFQEDFDAWERSNAMTGKTHRAAGMNTRHVTVRFQSFRQFVERTGLAPSLALLRSYAATLAASEKNHD